MRALIFFLVIAFAGLLASLVHGQTNGDLILQYKGGSGASPQFLTPSGTALLGFNGANPNRLEAIPRSTFTTPAQVAAGYQPLNGNLSTLAGVTPGTLGLNLLASANAATARGWLGLSSNDTPTFFGLIVADNANDYPLFKMSSIFGSAVISIENMTDDRVFYLPDVNGTLLTEDGNGASLTSLNASNISSGSMSLDRLGQSGATTGQAAVWNGLKWAPGTVTAPVTSVAGRTGAITLSTSDISGLGTIATQAANNVTITGGSITGLSAFGLGTISSAFIVGDVNTFYTFSGSCVGFRSSVDTTARLWVQLGIGLGSAVNSPDLFLQRDAANNLQLGTDGTTPSTQILSAADGTGTNATGADLVSQPGNGTGSGKSGKWAVETAPPGSSGTTATTMTRRMEIDEQGVVKINNATTVPASNPTGGGYLYIEGGALKYRGSSGTVTTIANP